MALAKARHVGGSQAATASVQQGSMPACNAPSAMRAENSPANPVESVLNPSDTDQPTAYTVSARRGPQRWASQPEGICITA